MGRVAEYVNGLTHDERERFRDLIDECASREARIHRNAARAEAALAACVVERRQFWQHLAAAHRLSQRLRESVGRLCLLVVPTPGTVN